nr:MAG: tail assembly chaperone protein [Bacteriophage sp.]
MAKLTVEAKELGLKPIEVDRSFGMKRKVGELNKEISEIQLEAQKDFSGAIRDMNVLAKLKKSNSEDERTLERLENKYGTGFGSSDPEFWDMRLDAIALVIQPKVNRISLTADTELKITEKYLDFIEDLAGINTKSKKEKFENQDLNTDAIADVAKRLVFTILDIQEDSETSEDDKKSNTVGDK